MNIHRKQKGVLAPEKASRLVSGMKWGPASLEGQKGAIRLLLEDRSP